VGCYPCLVYWKRLLWCTLNEIARFWSYLKGKRQDSQGVVPLRKTDGFLHNDAPTKAEILNQQFHSVYTKEDASNIPDMGNSPHQEFLPLLVRRCVGIRLSSLMVLPLANPVASLSGMTKISLVHCVCHQARCHRCTCHGTLKRMIRRRQRAYNKARSSQHHKDWDRYKHMKTATQRELRNAHDKYIWPSFIVRPLPSTDHSFECGVHPWIGVSAPAELRWNIWVYDRTECFFEYCPRKG
jgi:hypothetical protein